MLLAFVVLIYTGIILYCYITIYSEVRNQRRRLKSEPLPEERAHQLRKNKKAANTLAIAITVLLFSYLPVTILWVEAPFSDTLLEPHVLHTVSSWSYTSGLMSSLLHPLIYCWRSKSFAAHFARFCT